MLSGGATKGCGGGLKKETKKDIKTRHGRGCVDGRGRTLEIVAYTLLLTKAITEIYAWAWSGTAMIDANAK